MSQTLLSTAADELPVHEFLRVELKKSFSGSISRLAEACGVDVGMASRWVAYGATRQRTPSPDSCKKIARALDVDADYLLTLAGHREANDSGQIDEPVALSTLIAVLRRRWHRLDEPEQRAIDAVVRTLTGTPLEMRKNVFELLLVLMGSPIWERESPVERMDTASSQARFSLAAGAAG